MEARATSCMDGLVAKYDANGNGKIDVEERQGYVREVARLRRDEARRQAAQRPSARTAVQGLPQPRMTRDLFLKHDANRNGRLELEERAKLESELRRVAEEQFRKLDTNGDGELDRQEREALPNRPTRP